MSNLKEIAHQGNRNAFGGMCHGSCGLAEGTNPNTIKTTVACPYSIGGKLYSKAVTDNIAMSALAAQAANTDCMYLVLIDSAGAVSLVKGTAVAIGAGAYLPDNPAPLTKSVIGAIKVSTTVAFTSGSTDLSAAGVTATYTNLSHIIPDAF